MTSPTAEGRGEPIASSAREQIGILVLVAAQALCAGIFIVFFLIDITGIIARPVGYTVREAVQIAAGVGLLLSIVVSVQLLRRVLRRSSELEQSLLMAQGAFHELVALEFDQWGLTRAEREVALLALKGSSNSEIATMTGKSEGTVKSQTNAIFRKAGVQGRVGLVGHFMDELIGERLVPEVKRQAEIGTRSQ